MAKTKENSGGIGSTIAVGIILILLIVGLIYLVKGDVGKNASPTGPAATSTVPTVGSSPLSAPATTTFPSYYQDPSTWQTATDTNGGFSISYPLDFSVDNPPVVTPSTDWRLGANGTSGYKDLTLTVPKAFEPQTNFSDATLTVGSSADQNAVADCLTAMNGETEAGGAVYINGIQFNVFTSNDAGAGNIYQTTSYRTLRTSGISPSPQCYAVEYTIHSNQLANYPASYNLTQFDMDKIQSTLDLIVSTFNFI